MADTSLDKKIEKVNNSGSLKLALGEKIRELTNVRAELKSAQDKIKQLETEIEDVKKQADRQVINAEKTYKLTKTNDEIKKMVLGLRAKNVSNLRICNYLNDNGVSIEIHEVEYIINNINMLSPELDLYYKNQCKAYEESVKINVETQKQYIIDGLLESINILDKMINDKMSDNDYDAQLIKNILDTRNNHYRTLNGLIGNIVEENKVDDITTKREAVDNVMLNYTKKKSSSFRPQFVQKVN